MQHLFANGATVESPLKQKEGCFPESILGTEGWMGFGGGFERVSWGPDCFSDFLLVTLGSRMGEGQLVAGQVPQGCSPWSEFTRPLKRESFHLLKFHLLKFVFVSLVGFKRNLSLDIFVFFPGVFKWKSSSSIEAEDDGIDARHPVPLRLCAQ